MCIKALSIHLQKTKSVRGCSRKLQPDVRYADTLRTCPKFWVGLKLPPSIVALYLAPKTNGYSWWLNGRLLCRITYASNGLSHTLGTYMRPSPKYTYFFWNISLFHFEAVPKVFEGILKMTRLQLWKRLIGIPCARLNKWQNYHRRVFQFISYLPNHTGNTVFGAIVI